MTDRDFSRMSEWGNDGAGLIPVSQTAQDCLNMLVKGQTIYFEEVTVRDLNFHKAYMGLIGYIYDQLTPGFKTNIPKQHFYEFLKALARDYKPIYSFKDEGKRKAIEEFLKGYRKQYNQRIRKKDIKIFAELFGKFDLVEYKSIAFGRMSQQTFETYVRDQLPFIFDQVIRPLFPDEERYKIVIDKIEFEWKSFLRKL